MKDAIRAASGAALAAIDVRKGIAAISGRWGWREDAPARDPAGARPARQNSDAAVAAALAGRGRDHLVPSRQGPARRLRPGLPSAAWLGHAGWSIGWRGASSARRTIACPTSKRMRAGASRPRRCRAPAESSARGGEEEPRHPLAYPKAVCGISIVEAGAVARRNWV